MSRRTLAATTWPAVGALIRGADNPPRRRYATHDLVTAGFLIGAALLLPTSARAQSGQVVEYYHLDALGSVRVVTDQNAQVVAPPRLSAVWGRMESAGEREREETLHRARARCRHWPRLLRGRYYRRERWTVYDGRSRAHVKGDCWRPAALECTTRMSGTIRCDSSIPRDWRTALSSTATARSGSWTTRTSSG